MRRLTWGHGACALVGALLPLLILPAVAATACTIDNVASLLANGVPAMRTTGVPTGRTPWAPFTVAETFATGAVVRLAERPADLARALPPALRAAPYRWTFGDGRVGRGAAVTHRYVRPGLYLLTVAGYDRADGRWVAFDRALLRVVPRAEALPANLEFLVLRGVIAVTPWTWPLDGAVVAGVAVLCAWRGATRRRSQNEDQRQIDNPPCAVTPARSARIRSRPARRRPDRRCRGL